VADPASVVGVISDFRTEHGISHRVSCRALGVSESWFYKHRTHQPTRRELRRHERGPAPPIRPSGRVGPGQPQQIERDEVGGPLIRRPGRTGSAPLKPVLQLLEGEPSCGIPYDQLAVERAQVW
jgi:hypothetical protein